MLDFCLGFPYAGLLVAGGIVGAWSTGSLVSLAAGAAFGGALFHFSIQSLNAFTRGDVDYQAILGSQATCGVLTGLMATRWFRGGKFMPAGLLACLSFAMVAFYGLCMRIQKPKKVKAG